jgi:hypothetical protein
MIASRATSPRAASSELLPPHCPEAERGVLGCCLLDVSKTAVALKEGMSSRWFYDLRHVQIFEALAKVTANGGGDIVLVSITLREQGKLEDVGGIAYLIELQNTVPSAENLLYYLPELRDYFQRRFILDATTRLQLLARDPTADSAAVLADTQVALEYFHRQADANALPDIVASDDFAAQELPTPPELVGQVLHQGSKLIVGGSSKSFKTWALTDLAVSVATGTPWLGLPTQPGKVLYVNLEIQAVFFQRRIREVAAAKHVDLTRRLEIWNLRGFANDYRTLIPRIRNRIRDAGHALVVLDPTYKLLGAADENSATDVAALLNAVESVAVTSGAAVAMAGHFAKGNAAQKEAIDRISGSGVFARDPDSLITFTRHEEEGAFAVEFTLRNLPPVAPFVVRWEWPMFHRAAELDPARLKQNAGRPAKHTAEQLLEVLGNNRLASGEWKRRCEEEYGTGRARFYELLNQLKEKEKVIQSRIDDKYEQIRPQSGNCPSEKHQ